VTEPGRFSEGVGPEPIAQWALRSIWIVGGILAFLFTWLQIRNIFVPVLKNADPHHLRRFTLIVYYLCWVGGASFDVHVQREVYRRDPNQGRIPLAAFIGVTMLLAVAGILMWASTSDQGFALALVPFVIANFIGWRIVLARVRPMIEATRSHYAENANYFRLEQLELVAWYMTGWWQWARFALMAALVALANALCFSDGFRAAIAETVHSAWSDLGHETLTKLLPAISLLLFVLLAELWIWALRARIRMSLNTIESLMRRYRLIRLADDG
jgi:hypothetical protein